MANHEQDLIQTRIRNLRNASPAIFAKEIDGEVRIAEWDIGRTRRFAKDRGLKLSIRKRDDGTYAVISRD